jgi:hypothetical protein
MGVKMAVKDARKHGEGAWAAMLPIKEESLGR